MNLSGKSSFARASHALLVFLFDANCPFVGASATARLTPIVAVFRANRSDSELGTERVGIFSE